MTRASVPPASPYEMHSQQRIKVDKMHSRTCKKGMPHRVLAVMNSRRHFLHQLLIGSPLIVGARALGQDGPAAPAAEAPAIVPENDPVATALGYKEDASTVDATKYPQYKTGQICENCALYTGPAGQERGPCTIFQNRLVTAKGWCATYAPKPPAAPAD